MKLFGFRPLFLRLLLPSVALTAVATAQTSNLVTSGDIGVAGNWDTGALPGAGVTGTVNIDAAWPATSAANNLAIDGDLVFDGGIVLTAAVDVVASNPSSVTFNNVTVNVGDDIFAGGSSGNFIFNAGSVTNVDDDFEANGGGTITVNGGTHTTGIAPTSTSNFGAQNNSTLNFFGGTVTTGLFRATDTGTINLGGNAAITADTIELTGDFEISSDWTGSMDIAGVTDWQATLINGGATLDGVVIDAAIFASTFEVFGNGSMLRLITVPTPPMLLSMTPADDSTEVVASTNLVANFDEDIFFGATGLITIRNLTDLTNRIIFIPGADADSVLSIASNQLTIDLADDLLAGNEYVIEISNGTLEDVDGNAYAGLLASDDPNWSFTIDSTPPSLSALSPVDGAINIAFAVNLIATFDEEIALGASGTVTIRNLTNPADIVISLPGPDADGTLLAAGNQLIIDPTADLARGDEYAIEISNTAVVNLSGAAYAGLLSTDDPNWSFTTDGTPPSPLDMGPLAGTSGVAVSSNLNLTFDEDVAIGSGSITIHLASDGSAVEVIDVNTGGVTLDGGQVTINPTADLAGNTAYYVSITSGAFTDTAGNPYAGISDPSAWTFTTENLDTIIFADNFDREDGSDLNTSAVGKTGALAPLDWVEVTNAADPVIVGNELNFGETGAGGGWSVIYPDHNFIDPSITAGSGFEVSMDLLDAVSLGNTRFTGIAVGHSQNELDTWNTNNPATAPSDFFIGVDPTGTDELRIFTNGAEVFQTGVTFGGVQTLEVVFSNVTDFNAGSAVSYEAFFDGVSITTGTFTWSGTNENYLALYSNYTANQAVVENFVVNGNVAFESGLLLGITTTGSALDFSWNSLEGMEYDLVSTDDLEAEQDPSLWAPYNDGTRIFETIESTGTGIQTLTGVGIVGPKRFFALIERPISEE